MERLLRSGWRTAGEKKKKERTKTDTEKEANHFGAIASEHRCMLLVSLVHFARLNNWIA